MAVREIDLGLVQGPKGERGEPGPQGPPGEVAAMPSIGSNGNWFIGDRDTGILADVNRALDAKIVASTEITEPGFIMDGKTAADEFKSLNSNLKNLMFVKSYTLDNQTLKAGTTEFFTVPAKVIDGYSRGSYVVSIKNATSAGANSSFCFCYQSDLSGSGVTVGLRNTGSSNAKIKIQVDMEYFISSSVKP